MGKEIQKFEFDQNKYRFYKRNVKSHWNFYDSNNLTERVTLAIEGYELKLTEKIVVYGTKAKNNYSDDTTIFVIRQCVDFESKDYAKCVLSEVKGISDEKSLKILESAGVNTVNELLNYIDSGNKVKFVGPKTLDKIKDKLIDIKHEQIFSELHMILDNVNHAKKVSEKIFDIQELYNNPYKILNFLNLGFSKVDTIAREKLNISLDNEERIKYLVEYKFKQFNVKMSNYIDLQEFKDYLIKEVVYLKDDIDTFLDKNELIIVENSCVYLADIYEAETQTPYLLFKDMSTKISYLDEKLNDMTRFEKFDLSESQKQAITTIIESQNPCILTGEAGTGKSTITKYLCNLIATKYNVLLLSPTGKAAGRMRECTGRDSNTIHSFLYFLMSDFSNAYLTQERYGIKDDFVLIIDEFSMVDQLLFYKLLDEINNCNWLNLKKIIVIGDPYQLPSVGCGQVLVDMINSKMYTHVHLKEIQRQKENSNIVLQSKKVRNKECIENMKFKDFWIDSLKYENIKKFFGHFRVKYEKDIDLYKNVQLCTSTNKMREQINLEFCKNKKRENHSWPFEIGDKIINLKNDKELEISNGDFGIVEFYDRKNMVIYFYDIDKRVSFDKYTIKNLTYGYACTTHKLQGSEYKTIIIILENNKAISNYRSLYTAITRGKENVIILAKDMKDISDVCIRDFDYRRKTNFVEKIKAVSLSRTNTQVS